MNVQVHLRLQISLTQCVVLVGESCNVVCRTNVSALISKLCYCGSVNGCVFVCTLVLDLSYLCL